MQIDDRCEKIKKEINNRLSSCKQYQDKIENENGTDLEQKFYFQNELINVQKNIVNLHEENHLEQKFYFQKRID